MDPGPDVDWYKRIKRFGLWQVSRATLLRCMTNHLNFHFWTIQTRTPEPDYVPPEEHANEFEIRAVTLQEMLVAAGNPELGLTPAFVRSAFTRGDICSGALLGAVLYSGIKPGIPGGQS